MRHVPRHNSSPISRLFLLLTLIAACAEAHFELQYPPPRGPFSHDDEPKFCDGYMNATTDRTSFPLSNGYWALNALHPHWSAGVFISTAQAPSRFDDFELVNGLFKLDGEGVFCLPLELSTSNVTGLDLGQNATIQIMYDGGDGPMFQCADIVLENVASFVPVCSNGTQSTGAPSSPTLAPTSTSASSTGASSSLSPTSTPPPSSTGSTSKAENLDARLPIAWLITLLLMVCLFGVSLYCYRRVSSCRSCRRGGDGTGESMKRERLGLMGGKSGRMASVAHGVKSDHDTAYDPPLLDRQRSDFV